MAYTLVQYFSLLSLLQRVIIRIHLWLWIGIANKKVLKVMKVDMDYWEAMDNA